MALIKCPNCSNDVSDKAVVCPSCGFSIAKDPSQSSIPVCSDCGTPIKSGATSCEKCGCPIDVSLSEDSNSNSDIKISNDDHETSKKKKSKKNLIVLLVLILVVGIGFAVFYFSMHDSITYNKAVASYNLKDFETALNYFNTISDYEDASSYIKKCEYEISTEGMFLRALATGLEDRWEISNSTGDQSMTTDTWRALIDAEYEKVKDYKSAQFNDSKLASYAKQYIKLLEDASKVIKYYGSNETTFWNQYNPIYQDRCLVLKQINSKYTIPVSEENQSQLNDLVTEGELVAELRKILKAVKFKKVSDDYGWKQYEAIVENTSKTEFPYFSFDINLVGKDGTIVETTSSYTENWKVGQKNRFTFSTNAKFDRIEVYSCEY